MTTIWKYKMPAASTDPIVLDIPGYRGTLAAGLDSNNDVCVWVLVDSTAAYEEVTYFCLGTGWDLSEMDMPKGHSLKHIASVNQFGFIWHVFEEVLG